MTLYVWIRPGQSAPPGFRFNGCVSVWPDTGRVRAELWERAE